MEQKAKVYRDGDDIIIVVPESEEAIISSSLLSVCRGEVAEYTVKDVAPAPVVDVAPNVETAVPVFLQDPDDTAESDFDKEIEEIGNKKISIQTWKSAYNMTVKELYEQNFSYIQYLVRLTVSDKDSQKYIEHQWLKKYFEARQSRK